MSEERLVFNGINGATGDYLLPAMTPAELTDLIRGEKRDRGLLGALSAWWNREKKHLSLKEGADPKQLSQAGWGVVFALGDPRRGAIEEALAPLLELRREQAGDLYREFVGEHAYRPGEGKVNFLARYGVGPGPVDPVKVPYYLMLVGDPETIPYSFQYQMDVQFAIGRLHFESIEEYHHYAKSVVEVERNELALARQAALFGPQNPGDRATQMSASELVGPLAAAMAADKPGWEIQTRIGEDQATKANLGRLLGGDQTPALLFTASHGMGFPRGHRRQIPHQGALLCQEWERTSDGDAPVSEELYFSADDVGGSARLLGLLAFHFACFGAGTPRLNDFAHQSVREPTAIAPHAFVARLPQRLLGHPAGGALAVVGHVDRAWGYSFRWKEAGPQLDVFTSTMKRLMEGHPVGSAIEYFDERYAELSTLLTEDLLNIRRGETGLEFRVARMWTAHNDARSYVILGDPAVRLPVAKEGAAQTERPSLAASIATTAAATTESAPRPALEPQASESRAPEPGPDPHLAASNKPASDKPAPGEAAPVRAAPVQATEAQPVARLDPAQPELSAHKPPPLRPPSFMPAVSAERLAEADPELHAYWREHVRAGFERNSVMFDRILDGFMKPYYTTVWMYRILFAVGVLSFVAAASLSALRQDGVWFGLIFGGLSVASFLSYFLSQPLKALEQNLNLITWLGIIYNTYWTRLVYSMNSDTVQEDLQANTDGAIAQIVELIDKHDEMSGKRPKLEREGD